MKWVHLVKRGAYKDFVGKTEGKRRLRRLAPRWGIILKWFLFKPFGKAWTVLAWLRIGTGSLPFCRLL
jgi:hypothetical protein